MSSCHCIGVMNLFYFTLIDSLEIMIDSLIFSAVRSVLNLVNVCLLGPQILLGKSSMPVTQNSSVTVAFLSYIIMKHTNKVCIAGILSVLCGLHDVQNTEVEFSQH